MNVGFAIEVDDVDVLSNDIIAAKGTIKLSEADFLAGTKQLSGGGIQSLTITLQRQ